MEIHPARAAIVRANVPLAELPAAQRAARTRLDAAFEHATRFTLWRPPANGTMDYAPGVLLADGVAVPDGIEPTSLPAGRAAHAVLVGDYDGLGAAWGKLFEACAAQGLKTAGLNWEIYPVSDGPDARTELYALLA